MVVLSITDDLRRLSGLVDKSADAVVVPESGSPPRGHDEQRPVDGQPVGGAGERIRTSTPGSPEPVRRRDPVGHRDADLHRVPGLPWASNVYPS
ncbi:hypothetical protein [Micromonospora rubida]